MSFDLPEPWSSRLHPRRGGAGVRPVQPGPHARAAVDEQLRKHPAFLPGVLTSTFTEPELREAAQAWLDQDPAASATGAAVVALAAKLVDWQEFVDSPRFADLWLGERGLRFAAEAAVELFSLILVAEGDRPPHRAIERDGTDTMGVRRRRDGDSHRTMAVWFDPDLLVLLRVRAALAAAPDELYEEVVEVLAGYRGHGLHARCATSVLVPTRADWVAEDWADALAEPGFNRAAMLLTAISTPEQAAAAIGAAGSLAVGWPGLSATVVDGLGPAVASGLLLTWLDRLPATRADARRDLLGLIAVLPEDEAMRGLVERLGQRHVREALIEAAGRFPERALRQLAVPAGKPEVSDLLSARVRADPALAERVAAGLTGAPAARIRECLAGVDTVVPAPPEALPPLLADPPWRRRRASPPVVLDLKAPETPTTLEWKPGERDEWLSTPFEVVGAGDWAVTADRLRRGEPVGRREAAEFFVAGPEEPARSLLAEWKPEPAPECGAWMRRIVARFEADALLPLRRLAFHDAVVARALMLPFASPDVVWRMQVRPWEQSRYTSLAEAWLERHPEFAVRYLVPRAFGPDGPARRSAQHTLVHMAATGHTAALRSAAGSFGPEAAAATEALIATEPTAILPVKLPAIPKWFDPATLPPVRLRRPSADAPALVLPTGALRELAMVFALHQPPTEPYPGVEIVREACEPGDLARFAWGVFEAWLAAGANGRQGWALDALGLVGDDEVVRRLTPLIMEWPGQSGHARAVTGTGILAAIGTDVALTHLQRIVERSRFNGLRAAAERQVAHVAETMGLTAEQLADRLVPDLGLDGDGSLTLDYGPRRFVVGFDEELKPFVVDGAGKRLKNLPKPGARDDAERATAASQRFTALKKEVRALAGDQIRRLERAMVTGRRWPEEEFRRYFAGHPLVRHLTRRLLWGRFDGSGALIGGFRVAEDGTFADVHDDVTTIAGDEMIGVVHPVHLGAALSLWSEVFTDYQIVQPFTQLGRETAALTPAEAAGCKITRFRGRRVPTGAVLGLERRGWRRERPLDGGVQVQITVSPVDGLEVVLDLDPGIVVGAVDIFPEQTLGELGYRGRVAALGDLDPAVVSEVLRDLESLT
ncbi:DUF4132 domain-containing protein [Actinoplanes lobatus]|nr:DUF4132 domain-containing protein [Actinoplanes lobatus]MBB4745872.1 hypothetical protein [Actinoplanes lobatus]